MTDRIVTYIIEELGEGFERLRISECELLLRTKKLKFDFIMPCEEFDTYYNNDSQEKIATVLKKYCGDGFDISFNVKKTYSDVHVVRNTIYNFLSEKHQIAAVELTSKNFYIEGATPEYNIEIHLPSHLYTYLSTGSFKDDIISLLNRTYCDDFELNLIEDKSLNTASSLEIVENSEKIYSPKTVGINKLGRVLLGNEINRKPQRIADVKGDKERVTLCGGVSMFQKKTSKAGKLYYKFILTDPTDKIEVLYFPRGKTPEQFETTFNVKEVLIQGDLSVSEYGKSVFLRDAMLCEIDWNSVEGITFKEIPKFYKFVEPTPCESSEQESIFKSDDLPEFMKNKKFIVFDFETTGTNTSTCKVIEVAAIKIIDGKWVEQFTSFTSPGEKLDPEIIKLTSITDADLEGKPSFDEILPDFLKFCEDGIMVAHNRDYDVTILSRYARDNGYKFFNESFCTLETSRKYLTMNKSHKLKDVAAYYGVINKHEHRAIGDVEVTAKVFKELARFLS